MEKQVTLIVLLSRAWRIPAFFESLRKLKRGKYRISVLIIVDNPQIKDHHIQHKLPFATTIIHSQMPQVSPFNIHKRRQRISDLLTIAQHNIADQGLVFMVEDDTDVPQRALITLMADYTMLRWKRVKVGVISGVQAGRWGVKMIGGWVVDDVDNPSRYATIPYQINSKFKNIDAAGLYCYVVPAKAFRAVTFRHNFFGPDVNFGLDLRRLGYHNYIDWTVSCGHVTQTSVIQVDRECVELVYSTQDGTNFFREKTHTTCL